MQIGGSLKYIQVFIHLDLAIEEKNIQLKQVKFGVKEVRKILMNVILVDLRLATMEMMSF